MGFDTFEQSLWKELFGEEEGDSKDSGQNPFDEHFDNDGGNGLQQKQKTENQVEEKVIRIPKPLPKRV
jgi:hypothetical protein